MFLVFMVIETVS